MMKQAPLPQPTKRRLRVYAFDPNAAIERGSASFSQATIALAWNDPIDGILDPGPVNDYLEVIDIDPVSKQFYEGIDLDAPAVLAQDGLPPSEGDPRFHQQMVFAVAMKTIKLFERALGRRVTWRPAYDEASHTYRQTDRLRVYPHALREKNAYYSREKRALLFGYFKSSQRKAGASWIFTALSHDIIVHETTHAILDGLHPRYAEATSIDSLAFHEAFADIAALLSHFQLPEAVYEHVSREGGRLDQAGLLSGLARQFAQGTSDRMSLREYIGTPPDPDALAATTEPHDRGAILVAAVFDAFLTIYTARTEDLLRIGGIQPGHAQRLHPDLAARLTVEATKAADQVLRICIRALDYLPPVDVRFGEFLRAIVTADADLIPDDRLNYRLAFVEAFRRRGIFPDDCLSLSPDSLKWGSPPRDAEGNELRVNDVETGGLDLVPRFRRDEVFAVSESNRRYIWYWLMQPEFGLKTGGSKGQQRLDNLLAKLRGELLFTPQALFPSIRDELAWLGIPETTLNDLETRLTRLRSSLKRWLDIITELAKAPHVEHRADIDQRWEDSLGIYFRQPETRKLFTLHRGRDGNPAVEVSSVRTTRRAGPDGQDVRQLVIEVTQRRRGYLDAGEQARQDAMEPASGSKPDQPDFWFRGGATLIIDLREQKLRYVLGKSVGDDKRLDEQRRFLLDSSSLPMAYDRSGGREPFALLHRH
jgi:hypothetical protein